MFLFASVSSFASENIHQGQECINDESWGRKEINLCLAVLLCDQLLPIRESFDFTVEWFADFEIFASTGEERVRKYNESFDFTVEWFASTNDAHLEYSQGYI